MLFKYKYNYTNKNSDNKLENLSIIESKFLNPDPKMDPNFVTGLTEAEGSFSIRKHKDNRAKFKSNVGLRFKITMLNDETELLNMIKSFFDCGFITCNKNGSVDFIVRDIFSINKIIILHFLKHPLRGTKYLDFLSFKKVAHMIDYKEHLTERGIKEIMKISKNMNSYRKFPLYYSPVNTINNNPKYILLSGHFVNGFIARDGCLAINLKDKNFGRMSLQIS